MYKRCITILVLLAVLMTTLPLSARADMLAEPDNDFYRRNYDKCVALQRSFYANGRSGSVSLKARPGSGGEVLNFENGTVLFIMFTYNNNGTIWGVTEIWEPRKSGWLPMDDLLLKYDYISFEEDYRDEFYSYSGAYDALQEIPDLIFYTWPGSGEISRILEAQWRNSSEHEKNFLEGNKTAYKDSEGREWVFIPYLFGRINGWICLSDPLNKDIPAFNAEPQPELWQPGEEHLEPQGGLSLPTIVIILVAALVIITAVLIRVFWKKKRT